MDICIITSQETLPIRHQVLWPHSPIESCILDEDSKGVHFGGFIDGVLVCVASVFEVGDNYRLRKFAVVPDIQGKGYGTKMLRYICDALHNKNHSFLWLDARKTAAPFYEKRGFLPLGDIFMKRDIPYIKMQRTLTFLP